MSDPLLAASLSAQFTWIDWAIVVAYLAFTTWLGTALAGKQATIRDFFLGGRKLPWYAVSASIIATEISAVTFVVVPFIVFRPGGDMTYLQLGVIGTLLARIIVGYVLVPAYYKREIYSPYDYMGNQLGGNVRGMTTVLFAVGQMLAQSARVYLTAVILNIVLRDQMNWLSEQLAIGSFVITPLAWSIVAITLVAVLWTYIGGIATVIWTDAILFLVFLAGAVVALVAVCLDLPGGFGELVRTGWNAKESGPWGKFTFFNFDPAPWEAYTIWTAAIASTWGGIYAYGTDQLLAQRMFCCKNERAARLAIISSTASQVVTFTVALVGVGLFAYYKQPATPEQTAAWGDAVSADFPRLGGEAYRLVEGDPEAGVEGKGDRIFPIFIVEGIPQGFSGLIIAGIFAAAVSSMTSILAALSQTTMSAFYIPLRRRAQRRGENGTPPPTSDAADDDHSPAEARHMVVVGRSLVLIWGVGLAGMAFLAQAAAAYYPSILDLALAMAGYAGGALLAGFMLGFLPLKVDGRGFMYSAPLSVLCVFAMLWRAPAAPWAFWVCVVGGAILLIAWLVSVASESWEQARRAVLPPALQTVVLGLGVAMLIVLNLYGYWEVEQPDGSTATKVIAWPWMAPIGSTIAFVWGYLLARRKPDATATHARAEGAASPVA